MLTVGWVDPADLGGLAEVANACGVTRQAVLNWPKRYSDFPAPVVRLAATPVWRLTEVVAWRSAQLAYRSGGSK